jgi:hypothetical protein
MMSVAVALRSTSIVFTPCAPMRATTSGTPDNASGSDVPLAVSCPARMPSVMNPSRATVTRARNDPFCSSVFVGSCASSQTRRAKWRANETE